VKKVRSVLIVDDSATSRMIIQRCVEMCGLEVTRFLEAENGIDALTLLSDGENGIDLVFSDINMPKMDGSTFIKLVKNRPSTRDIPVVVTSSIAASSIEPEMRKLGVMGVIQKPVTPEKVIQALGGEE